MGLLRPIYRTRESKDEIEVIPMGQLVSTIAFRVFRNFLTIHAISSNKNRCKPVALSSLTSVIHFPTEEDSLSAATPFHAPFPYFVTDPTRSSTSWRKRDQPKGPGIAKIAWGR